MRQLREMNAAAAAKASGKDAAGQIKWDEPSPVRDLMATWTVVFGGEWVSCSLLGLQPSFLTSPTFMALYGAVHTFIASIPSVPAMSLQTEIPLSLLDGLSRAYLVCRLFPSAILTHSNPTISSSPWALLMISLLGANSGFFLVNLFGMLRPEGIRVSTPLELQPYGWTTVDLWCAPLATALYAYWTNAQPWWGEIHAKMLGYSHVDENVLRITAVNPDTAMARCVIVLAALFAGRTWKNFGPDYLKKRRQGSEIDEKKTQ